MAQVTKYNRIKAELAEAGRQNQELANFLQVHITTVSDWCTNTNQPSIQDLYKISEFLGINVRRLLIPTRWNPDRSSNVSEEIAGYFVKPVTKKKVAKKKKG